MTQICCELAMEIQVPLTSFFERDLNTIKGRIETLLENYPEARGDDKRLCDLYYQIVENVTTNLGQTRTPPETITRLRRLVQVSNPMLAPKEDVKHLRANRQELFKEAMTNGI